MASAQSQAPAATSSLKVMVTDQAGTALENIEVTLDTAKRAPANSAQAQPSTGTVRGAYGDPDRRELADGDAPKVKTDKTGMALFDKLKAGRYRITIKDDSYETALRPVQIDAGKTITQQFKLAPKKK